MARTVKPKEFASKRREILEAAQRLVFTKGYEQVSVRDIIDELSISSGAFHHYFGSRQELLEGLIEQIRQASLLPLLPIVQDPDLSAVQKLQGIFDKLDSLRMAHRADLIMAAQVWYTDDNALVRLKVDQAVFEQRAPLLAEIIRQGTREGLFTASYPDQAGEAILSLLQGMGNTHARLLLSLVQQKGEANPEDQARDLEQIVVTHGAYMEAIERVLGAPSDSLARTDAEAVKVWVAALRDNDPA
jgi:AcrR family transcriptional regulator